ncbi:MAG: hypothetical protein E7642_01025 [Ruminococcaceae bacterium]|nr:hypothetical protein [Oscillospiraceae bacterium]
MKEIDKKKYINIFEKNAYHSIVVDVLVAFLSAFAIFGPIYQDNLLEIKYSVYNNIRLFLGFSSFFSRDDWNIVCTVEVITILFLAASFFTAIVDIILNIIFIDNRVTATESKIQKYSLVSACKPNAATVLFIIAFIFFCISRVITYLESEEIIILEGLFFGNTYNMSAARILVFGVIALVFFAICRGVVGKQIEMNIKVGLTEEKQEETKSE